MSTPHAIPQLHPVARRSRRGWCTAALVALASLSFAGCTAPSSFAPPAGSPPTALPVPAATASPTVQGAPCGSAGESAPSCGASPPASPSATSAATATAASPTPTASPATAGASTPVVVTAAQNETSLALNVGERFELALGTGTSWTVTVADPSVVGPVAGADLAPGVQGVYVAKAPGTTTLGAIGRPVCTPGTICPQYRIAFTLTVHVR